MNKMQKVLDLDLDIFVNPLVEFCKESEDRADSGQFSLAPFEFIMDSLDRRLKLSDDEEAPGDCLVYHSEVYYRWRSLVQSGRLKVPFEVVHVDGHADLGMGDASYVYLFEEWIYEANKMKNPKTGGWRGLGSGNYLAFAIANGWVGKLTYVCHDSEPDDLTPVMFKDWDVTSNYLETKKVKPGEFESKMTGMNLHAIEYERDRLVPFKMVKISDYVSDTRFDYAYAVKSPSYTPVELDALDPVLEARISNKSW